jgi:hypothetical protein
MNISEPENKNYAATVVSIKTLTELDGCDNVVGTPLFGFQAIVGKSSTKIGDLGIIFPAETQLSEEYARKNNLHRHGNLNDDEGAKGYLEDNRRIKAMKFRGHRSDALFMPLTSLSYTKINLDELNEGDVFDTINGKEICKKYVVKSKGPNRLEKNKAKKFTRVDAKFMPEHYDTENYWRNKHVVPQDKKIVVTQKLHGTSIRIGNTVVARELKLHEKLLKKLGVKIQGTEYDYIFGSRKVIKDINNPNQNHFYNEDIWTLEGKKLDGILPEGFILYGELIGYTPDGAAIQKNYTYCHGERTCTLFVYRVAFINPQGRVTDLSWDQVKEFCRDNGLVHVPELWTGLHRNFKVENFIDKRFFTDGAKHAVPLDVNMDLVDEGVCVRVDGLAPYIIKAKSPVFLQHETKMLDEEVVDLEVEGSEA